jgi:hypothetical protein
MDILNTRVFIMVLSLLQSLWADTFGKIFVLTLIAYATSYMVYSGYLSWFSGGYGGFLFSQVGFTPIDFLSLIPTIFALIIRSLWSLVRFFFRMLAYFFLIPLFIAIILTGFLGLFGVHFFAGNISLGLFGILIWYLCILAWIILETTGNRYKKYIWYFIAFSAFGILLWFFGSSNGSSNLIIIPFLNMHSTYSSSPNILSEILAVFFIVTALVYPFIIGSLLASLAVNGKYLSQLLKISLNRPMEIPGGIMEIKFTKFQRNRSSSKGQKGIDKRDNEVFSYSWATDHPAYLIGSFSKTTAFYLPPETTLGEYGKMVLLTNEIICSLEIEGRKKDR